MSIPRENNFDLIRLLAATQVVVCHAFVYLGPSDAAAVRPVLNWLGYFPGVPIFFAVSGFLIYWSFERNVHDIRGFYKNRFLRIYPGLWVCFALTLALLFAFQQISLATFCRPDFLGWMARQLTFAQFGTPEILKHWGDGQVNRSLWTISLELQFYAVIPFIYYLFKSFGKRWEIGWAVAFFGSIGVWFLQCHLPKGTIIREAHDLCVPCSLYNFLYGMAFYKCWERNRWLLEGRFLYWLVAYLLFCVGWGSEYRTWPYSPEPVRMMGYFLLSGATISLAFTWRTLSEKLIRGFDISYGVYIYHGLVLNCFIWYRWAHRWNQAILILPISCLIGAISWVFVERPMLRKKNKPLRQRTAGGAQLEDASAVSPAGAALTT